MERRRYNGDISCDAKWHDQDVCNIMGTPSGLMIQSSFFHGTCCPNLGYTHIFGPSHMDIKIQKRWTKTMTSTPMGGWSTMAGRKPGTSPRDCQEGWPRSKRRTGIGLRGRKPWLPPGLWLGSIGWLEEAGRTLMWNPVKSKNPCNHPKKTPKHHPPNFSKLENLKKEFEVENLHIPETCGKIISKWLSFPPISVRRGRYSALARRGGWALGQRLGTQGAGADAAGGLEHLGTWEV